MFLGHFGARHQLEIGNTTFNVSSYTETVHVLFHTDHSGARSGWRLEWSLSSLVDREQTLGGVLTSPNFPKLYPKRHMFTQTITVPEGKAIQLHFTDFNTEPGTDYVKVTSGNSYYLAPHLSGNSLPNDIVSPHNTVYVHFKTHYKSLGRSGWRLEWTEVPSPADVQPACPRSSEFQLAS